MLLPVFLYRLQVWDWERSPAWSSHSHAQLQLLGLENWKLPFLRAWGLAILALFLILQRWFLALTHIYHAWSFKLPLSCRNLEAVHPLLDWWRLSRCLEFVLFKFLGDRVLFHVIEWWDHTLWGSIILLTEELVAHRVNGFPTATTSWPGWRAT